MKLAALVLTSGLAAGAAVAQPTLAPMPAPDFAPGPAYSVPAYPGPAPAPAYVAPPIPEYGVHQHSHAHIPVKYEDLKRRHPCAIPMTVCVDTVCGPVLVDICVPPHTCPPEIKHKRRKIVYDFGDYEVDIHDRKDHLVVDYDN